MQPTEEYKQACEAAGVAFANQLVAAGLTETQVVATMAALAQFVQTVDRAGKQVLIADRAASARLLQAVAND